MNKTWWKEAVIYQIYPRSFNDSNGDGIGDIKGITEKLDYLTQLGVNVLWLSPIFKSPNDDNGYDVSDYCEIMDEFGTMEDFDELLAEAHQRKLKVILDLVVNHSSDEHRWFQESRKSANNPYSDYYIWKKEKPNNWQSFFGGDAWLYDDTRGAYFLHLFTKKQPDLNWENPKVREEVYDLMRFWFDKGIDGFRMDVIPLISKRLDFPNIDSKNMVDVINHTYANGPRLHEFLKEMNEKVSSDYDVVTVGEGIGVSTENCLEYIEESRRELNMLYHFDHMFLDWGKDGKFDPVGFKLSQFKKVFTDWHNAVGETGWINIFLDNHDFPRMISRFGNDGEYRKESAKLLATLLLTMRGTPCIFQGSEIGMTNVERESLDDFDDIEIRNNIEIWKKEGKDLNQLLNNINYSGRDNARTPVQWDSSKNGGFSTGDSWLKVNPNYNKINAAEALRDNDSIFYYYQRMLKVRKIYKTLVYGDYKIYEAEDEQLFAYERFDEEEQYLILLNFSDEEYELKEKELPDYRKGKMILNNYSKTVKDVLSPWEARIYIFW